MPLCGPTPYSLPSKNRGKPKWARPLPAKGWLMYTGEQEPCGWHHYDIYVGMNIESPMMPNANKKGEASASPFYPHGTEQFLCYIL
ncbi:hypothetical protein D1872_110040 [compost metagenome]